MNYYPFHLGDYAAHTAHLEPMEDLAYRRMLDLYYRTEKPLPSDWRDIARLIRMRDHAQAIEAVLSEFFVLTDAGWTHARCDSEISKMQDKQAKARASAEASVNARRTNAQRTLNERSADVELPTPTPTPKKKTPPTPQGGRFDEFWNAWPKHPRKAGRPQCERKWRSWELDGEADQILAALEAQKASAAWAKDGGEFIPAPLVWLNQRRWEAPTEGEAAAEQAATHWHECRSGIEAKGAELGIGRWDEQAFSLGRGDPWPAYQARVFRAAGFEPRRVA